MLLRMAPAPAGADLIHGFKKNRIVCANIHADPGGSAMGVALTCKRQSPSVKCATG